MCHCSIKIHSFLKLLVTLFIGIFVGTLAVGLASFTEALKSWKNIVSRTLIHDGLPHGIMRAALFHSGYSAALILLGSALVRPQGIWLPHAATCRVCQINAQQD